MRVARFALAVSSLMLCASACVGQGRVLEVSAGLPATPLQAASLELPDAPGFAGIGASSSEGGVSGAEQAQPAGVTPQLAKKHAITIKAGQTAQTLSAGDKFAIGITKQISLGALASWSFSAGYSHLLDNRPHYGTDSAGFGERLGAAALRDTTQSIFYYGIYSNLFREDPRYYVLGPQHPFKQRAIYAASRVVVTRRDKGGNTPNWALLAAIGSSGALANAYYPSRDQDVTRTVTGVLTSLAIRAGTQQLREFSGDIRQALHRKH